jgi:GDP-mannose 6-dehydrogenase
MQIGIFGLGYVGCVTGACLSKMGHSVIGVDISPAKVRMLNRGHSPILGKDLEGLVSQTVRSGRLRATLVPAEAVTHSEISMVCVGTPSKSDGGANLAHLRRAVLDIGRSLRAAKGFHTVVVRSTVPPGSTEREITPALERSSGKKAGRDFGVCFQPEFLREGSSVDDFFHPPLTVLGTSDPRSTKLLMSLWRPIKAPVVVTSPGVAEIVKYASNAFHALKICFANEIGALCRSFGVDSHEVMRIFVQDTRLNVSPLYLRPGFAFGGPCLPKDVRALCALGRNTGVEIPLLRAIPESNKEHLRRAVEMILATGRAKVGVLGLVFKSDTDDLRESPVCLLVRDLVRARKRVKVYDPQVRLQRLMGANRSFVEKDLPQLPRLLAGSLREVLNSCGVIVVAGTHPEFAGVLGKLKKNQALVDLVRLPERTRGLSVAYRGICW